MYQLAIAICVCLLAPLTGATQPSDSRTVIGPSNLPLHDGAERLRAGDGEEGIRLTRQGLAQAQSARERGAAYANLCAGYILTKDFELALEYCNQALIVNANDFRAYSNRALAHYFRKDYQAARRDADSGLAINPHSSALRKVDIMIEDVLNPVEPGIIVEYSVDEED